MNKQKFFIAVGLLGLICTLSSFNLSKSEKSNFKNLQVLPKDISSDQLDEIMNAYCVSLDVDCNFCHKDGNMASDDYNEKIISRKMITMTNEINEKYFGKNSGTVGCMTCHNGKKSPNDLK